MVILLYLVAAFIVGLAGFAAYKLKSFWPAIVGVVVLALYVQFQPSYTPSYVLRGVEARPEPPAFEVSEAKIVDNLLKPKPGELYDAEREAAIKKGLPKAD